MPGGAAVVTAVEGTLEGGGGIPAVGVAGRTGGVTGPADGSLSHDSRLLSQSPEKKWDASFQKRPEEAGASARQGSPALTYRAASAIARWSVTFGFYNARTARP
ncbi:hypothetical protein TPA0598_01_09510 [Streptomyces lydicamycinicus]|uniref:Uncharacterized protein n=1 Tax=Streptomyces lydicamycinicus TaxID=1546107 RepID=A0A0P4R1A8_9ACTN|nr:hypothetical protein TPA0598_01_09510 [Streptomyces lydicamycinicus]